MESNSYLSQIGMDLYYFQHIHHMYPQTIFISDRLFNVIDGGKNFKFYPDGSVTYCDVPVQTYKSDKLEYHFAVSKYEF